MKRILAFFAVVAITVAAFAGPAFAANLSAAEQKVLDKFESELDYWVKNANFPEDHKAQYLNEAKNALLAVDLSDDACAEFEAAIDDAHKVFVDKNCKTAHDLLECREEILASINKVGAKYYDLHVTVIMDKTFNSYLGKEGKYWAKVTYTIDGKQYTASTGGTSVVKQTGFDLSRTAMVTVASAAVLVSAYAVARKMRLFA